jgi:DNA-binding HxlR family transcriptional regulator
MSVPRPYGDGCAAAHAMELVGERWALLVVRELLLGPKRFADLRRGLPRVSPTVLSQRLRELEDSEILRRQRLGPPASTSAYELTDWGRQLEPIVIALARWAGASPALDRAAPLGPDSLVLHMRARYRPPAEGSPDRRYEIQLGDDTFTLAATSEGLAARRGGEPEPDATVETDTATLTDLLFGLTTLDDARSAGTIRIDGDAHALEHLLQACS